MELSQGIFLSNFLEKFADTVMDVIPIVLLIGVYQMFVLKRKPPQVKKLLMGLFFVIIGLALFLLGLEQALFPVGEIMAVQLSNPDFIGLEGEAFSWTQYHWVLIFATLIGFSTTLAEPSLTAVAIKANEISGGAIGEWALRLSVAVGAGIALFLGVYRIISGTPLYYYLMVSYGIVLILSIFADKSIIALAYDTGGVTTSTVTVPVVTALGLGLSSQIPGRSLIEDGFGLIAMISVLPIITVLLYSKSLELIKYFSKKQSHEI
jgi:hypothetical protein